MITTGTKDRRKPPRRLSFEAIGRERIKKHLS
jgi:hypothetical protein